MDKNRAEILGRRIDRTVAALKKNNFDARAIKDTDELIKTLDELIPKGASCSVGGSMTLFETGVIDYLKNGDFNYLDRYAEGADTARVFHEALSCDAYLMSSNAITESGELYNMDGNGNRVAALIYGPKKVIVIAGENKIVKDLAAAVARNRETAAPMNGVRLGIGTPCAKTGVCLDCSSPDRFCCHELISRQQRIKGRVVVLILPGTYGY